MWSHDNGGGGMSKLHISNLKKAVPPGCITTWEPIHCAYPKVKELDMTLGMRKIEVGNVERMKGHFIMFGGLTKKPKKIGFGLTYTAIALIFKD